MPTATSLRTDPSHAMLHKLHYNVKAFGAVGDGTTDDTTAITSAISAAFTAHQPVFFPAVAVNYKVTSTIDLTPYRGTVLLGEGSRQGVNGQLGRGSNIGAASSVSPIFKWDGDGNSAGLRFENLGFGDPECAIRISDSANVEFKNCAFSVSNTAGANNCCVLLENMFWVWFEDCHFNAPSTTTGEASVILRGKEPSVNADHCYLISFKRCRFWNNGVYYRDQNDIAVDATHAEAIYFEDCDTENFDSGSALIEFTKTASTNWGGRYVKNLMLKNVNHYDFVGSPANVRFSVPNGINTFVVENIGGGIRLFERNSGAAGLFRGFITGVENIYPFKDGSGTNLDYFSVVACDNSVNIGGPEWGNARINFVPTASTVASIMAAAGAPENVVTANVGSLYLRTDGGAGTSLYVKQTGSGNTGWVGK